MIAADRSPTSPFSLVGSLLNLAPLRAACPAAPLSAHIPTDRADADQRPIP